MVKRRISPKESVMHSSHLLAAAASCAVCAGGELFPLGDGSSGAEPAAVWPPGPHDAPHIPHGHGCCCICKPAGAVRVPLLVG